ncbi:xanthine dehydrogenase family protein molybdopterin-binding subunit [Bradyrhizobium tunisiense]|uniref:xanthine dehydrogenase family protein molybdopterin-binding subunit n=1 Tax=Bradyrhizobium tunisiense TaxID=3278709 RepID=UPI0035E29E1D
MEILDPQVNLSRRSFLTAGAASVSLLAFRLPLAAAPAGQPSGEFVPNAFIRIDGAGRLTLVMPQVEMGQGVYTSVAMILAEELDADLAQVSLEHAPPDDRLYGNPAFGLQVTGNSNSIRAWWMPLRKAGATARAMLIAAAAERWQVDPSDCTASRSEVLHSGSGRRLGYGELAPAARDRTPPERVQLKSPDDFVIIGQPIKRLDTPNKVNGKASYGIDVILPGMKIATVRACPVFGGKVEKVDDRTALKIAGVRKVVVLDDMVAVIGDHMWAAKQGADALEIDWDEGPNATVGSEEIWKHLRRASEQSGAVAKTVGNVAEALKAGDRFEAAFELPFLAHATMEPINATVHVRPDACEIWTGTQIMTRVQSEAAKAAGLPVEKVVVHNHLLGGGFGRKLEPDMVVAAVKIAKQVDYPVKVVWTREEDTQHDFYRPIYRDRIEAAVSDGKISAWNYKITGSSVLSRWLPPAFHNGVDGDAVDAAVDMPYDVPNLHIEYVRAEPPAVPTGFWRGVGPNNNVFAIECAIDEIARRAERDPVEFRRSMLGRAPRLAAALDLAAHLANWGEKLPARVGRGVCLQPSFGTFIATIVEAEVDGSGEIRLRKVVSVVDAGIVVNPDTVKAQIEGGLIFGLTAALYGDITIRNGRVQQSNFHDYRMMRINETPAIEVHVVKSGEPPGGMGECGVNAGPPALRNAIYAATGVALRRLPIDRSLLAVKLKA